MTITEKDAVLRERRAFLRGVNSLFIRSAIPSNNDTIAACNKVEASVDSLYPLPKVTRPRYAADPLEWRIRWHVSDDAIVGEANDSGHYYGITLQHSAFVPVSTRVAVWADLLANPTEEVDQ